MADENIVRSENHFRDFTDNEQNHIRLMWQEYVDSIKSNGGRSFEDKYGPDSVDVLTETYRRLNQKNSGMQTAAELEAGEVYADAMEDKARNGRQEKYKEKNLAKQIGKAGIRGTALLWNGVVDIGRGFIDPENWAYMGELMGSVNDDLALGDRDRSWQNYWQEKKRDAVRGDKGFHEKWAALTLEEEEVNRFKHSLGVTERSIYNLDRAGMAGAKWDEIPFLNEDLGWAGRATEIAVQEILTMGPLALGKLYRANKVAKYFADKAGGTIKRGRMTKDGYRSGRIRTELGDEKDIKKAVDEHDANYNEYLKELEGLPVKEQKRKMELLKVNQTKGKFLKFGGGAYSEAEIVASAGVVAGGVWFQSMFGRNASIIGEVGGGIAGPTLLMRGGRNVLDWMNYLIFKLPGSSDTKTMRALKAAGFKESEILKMSPTKKAKFASTINTMPIPRWMGFTSRERKRLNHIRHWDNEFESLPDHIRDPLMERTDTIHRLVAKFDEQAGGTGKLFTTIDRAFDMAWLASLRNLTRNKKKIGHGVKLKFDIDEMALQRREMETARELNKLLKEMSEKAYGNVDFGALLHVMDIQLMKNMDSLAKAKGVVSAQANEIKKGITRRMDSNLEQFSGYIDASGFRNNWDNGIDIVRKSDPVAEVLNKFDETAADDIARVFADTREPMITSALQRQGMRLVPGKGGQRILMPIGRKTYNQSVKYSNDSEKIFKESYDADRTYGEAHYDNVDGFKVSPAKAKKGQTPAIDSERLNVMTAKIGRELMEFTDENPSLGSRIVSNIRGQDVNVEAFLAKERFAALQAAHRNMGDDKYFELLDDLNRQLDSPYEIDLDKVDDITGAVTRDLQGISNLEKMIAADVGLALPSDSVKLNISLSDLHSMRSGLWRKSMNQMKSDAQRVTGGFNMRVASIIGRDFEEFDNLQQANKVWREQVGDKWRRGTGRNIINGMKEPEEFFKLFIKSRTPTRARKDFDLMFKGADGAYDEGAVEGLQFTVNQMLDNNQKIDDIFWTNFGEDVIGVKLEKGEDIVEKSSSIYRTMDTRKTAYRKEAEGITEELGTKVDEIADTQKAQLELGEEFNFEGLNLAKMEGLFGKRIVDQAALRKAILEESYLGGDSRKLRALVKLIKNPDPIKVIDPTTGKRGLAKLANGDLATSANIEKANRATLQKIMHQGAMEEVYNLRATKGLGFEESVMEVMPDGTKQLSPARLHEELVVDSGALQVFLSRNNVVLEELMEPKQLEDLQALSSLVTLVVGDMTEQAIENFPRSLKLSSLMSRAYGVVRGVVSPRWVLTELMIQHVRFGRGKMITDMATDPDAFELLSEVILRDGLTNPRIRTEFVEYFYGTQMRIARDVFEAEEGDIHSVSEDTWNAVGGGGS